MGAILPCVSGEELAAARGGRSSLPLRWAGVIAVVWVVLAGLGSLAPALARGSALGTYDIAAAYGIGRSSATPYNVIASDQVQQSAPWAALDWTEVHGGHLPLWNPYNAMGTPLLADFQSAGLSLPMLVAYAMPRRFAYDVTVIVKLIIAGTGLVFASRVLRLGWVAAAFAGTVGELSGSFSGWLGWPMAGVICWTGWVLGAGLLLAGGRRPRAALPLLAGAVAFAVYGGHPESVVLLAVTVTFPVVVALVAGVRRDGVAAGTRRLAALAGALLAGAALCAPLLLTGAQALHGSVHQARTGSAAFPLRILSGLIFSGYWGYPIRTSQYFGLSNYYETASFVGITALVLAAVGLLRRGRRPLVLGVGLSALVLGGILFAEPITRLVVALPAGKLIIWSRGLIPFDLVVALLAGVGLDAVLTGGRERATARLLALGAVAGAAVLAVYGYHDAHHPPAPAVAAHIRAASFAWPAIQAGVLLAAAPLVLAASRAGPRARPRAVTTAAARVGVAAVVASEVGFLLLGTPRLWSTSRTAFAVTPAIARLQATVGDQRVGFRCPNATQFADIGILPEANAAYGVAEAEMYDAVLPLSYLRTYARLTHTPAPPPNSGNFCVPVTTAAVGRAYGIEYVLEARGAPAPAGAVAVGRVGNEYLWRVPGASVVSVQPASAPLDAPSATPVAFGEKDPARLTLHLDAAAPSRLELHIGAYPGWHARIDGRPLRLRPLHGQQLQALVPAGRHTVVVTYRPSTLVVGLWLAAAAAVALVAGEIAAALLPGRRRRRRADRRLGAPSEASAAGEASRRPLTSLGERAWRNRQTRQV